MISDDAQLASTVQRSDLDGGLLVHEWLGTPGGSERVFERIANSFPSADIWCLWNDDANLFADRNVRETLLARTVLRRHKAAAAPFMPLAWSRPPSTPYRWVLVSSHSFAHHARVKGQRQGARPLKIVYAHTPARYVWEPDLDTRTSNVVLRAAARALRPIDRRAAQNADVVIANSAYVSRRIARHWGKSAQVIHPPVDVRRIKGTERWVEQLGEREAAAFSALSEPYVLGASRFIDYKRLDLVIRAGELVGTPVVIAGWGPKEQELRRLAQGASVPVTVLAHPSDELLFALYQNALAFIFPPVEDFGMMPIEAMACGTPVVVNIEGGASESISWPHGGDTFDGTEGDLRRATVEAIGRDRAAVATVADKFAAERFDAEITTAVTSALRSVGL